MAGTRELRRRIRSIRSTAQITKAMQMVAASKMRKAQQAAIAVRPFIRMVYRIQRRAVTRVTDFSHPLLDVRHARPPLTIQGDVLAAVPPMSLTGASGSGMGLVAVPLRTRSSTIMMPSVCSGGATPVMPVIHESFPETGTSRRSN